MRPDDRRNRPEAEAQPVRRADVLLGWEGTFIPDHGPVDVGPTASSGAYGIVHPGENF